MSSAVQLASAKRLGINLGTQNYSDSQEMMRNIIFRNPGFEGEIWQSILHCKTVTTTSCTDDNFSALWGSNFFKGATAEPITGAAVGTFLSVSSSSAANGKAGVGAGLQFATSSPSLAAGDYLVVRFQKPGNAQAGWWIAASGGATLATEFYDLSPSTPGVQALRITASGAGQTATVTSYADVSPTQSFLQMQGGYTLSFRAKGTGGSNQISINLCRLPTGASPIPIFTQAVTLTSSWADYSYTFQANDTGPPGSIALTFQLASSSMLLDDVALTADAAPGNPTVYRNEVVSTLQALNPGILRFMDSGLSFGSSLDNMLAPAFARQRAGYSALKSESDDIPVGLHDFLVLCQTVGAEPWYTLPPGTSTTEMANLMDYLGGSTSTVYGARRAALGQSAPWTSVFAKIHLEVGNEVWNPAFGGANIADATSYGKRAGVLFGIAVSSPSYSRNAFDLVLNGWAATPSWGQTALAASSNYDTIDAAPLLFNTFNNSSSTENIFGPMFAQPESMDSISSGIMSQQAQIAGSAARPANLAVYATGLSTLNGIATQTAINSAVPSLGAGLAATEHMLLMMRDLGINNQALFSLGGFSTKFTGSYSGINATAPLFGSVVDMGVTNLKRPVFLAEQLANSAILPTMLATSQSGANPTWNQAFSSNDNISLSGAHYIQSFDFTDGTQNNLVLFNLNRTTALPVVFAGTNAPMGSATITTLTASAITANNEQTASVAPATTSQTLQAGSTLTLPPFSMTVVSTSNPPPAAVTSVSVSCQATQLPAGSSTPCAATVTGTGAYNSAVTWQANPGTISNSSVYTAPASVPSQETAMVQAVSQQDPSKSGSQDITLISSGPRLSIPTISPATTTAVISWTTDVPTRSGINYGTDPNASGNTTPYVYATTTTPSFTLTGLTPGTLYYIAIYSSTADNKSTTFASYSFTTANPPPAPGAVIANGYPYFTGSYGFAYNVDTVLTIVPFWPAADATNLQLVFGNAALTTETPGPPLTIRASFEYPQGTIWPVYFNGSRDGQLNGGGVLTSDPTNFSVKAGQVGYVRVRVIRNAGATGAPFANYTCEIPPDNLSPNTTTRKNGQFDGCEYVTSQSGSDAVMTANSGNFTSSTIALNGLYSVGQQVTVAGAGAGGSLYTGTIVSTWGNTAVLSPAASVSVSGAAWTYKGADKTSTASAYIAIYGGSGYAPSAILGQPVTQGLKSATILGDSIGAGAGASLTAGSWPIQALNPAGVSAGLATTVASGVPFVQMSMGGETIKNLELVHNLRYSQIPHSKYTLIQIGTNDSSTPVTTQQADHITLWNQITALGSRPIQPTMLGSRANSTDNWLTTTNQTPDPGTHATLEAMNAWLRDGAPISASTGLAVPVGTSSTTANRVNYYDVTGKLVSAASGPSPSTHPLASGFVFDISPSVETSIGSGIWKVDPANRTVTDAVTVQGSHYITSATANFTPADNGRYIGGPGIPMNATMTYVSATQIYLSTLAQASGTGVTVTIAGPYGKTTVDGLHPNATGHFLVGQAAALGLANLQ